ncbi:hypothetical protein [Sphingobacterium deserti]|uniref:Uncharacterized protein n=1 Tax=Sphingobacterium deserti TaxID=1229276 RepID=A0A0B8T174_9SPHI|nr:hypothetical protein [Sphingobacterium deserti]KGE12418.1 hypothetical protein DI53_3796 [Sphingobacterium deserti]
MNTKHTIKIEIPLAHQLLIDSRAASEEILMHINNADKRRINDYVIDQLADRDGAPELIDLQIGKFQYDEGSQAGTFRLHFKISRRFCCADTTGCNDDYIDFRFVYGDAKLHADGHYFQWSPDN